MYQLVSSHRLDNQNTLCSMGFFPNLMMYRQFTPTSSAWANSYDILLVRVMRLGPPEKNSPCSS